MYPILVLCAILSGGTINMSGPVSSFDAEARWPVAWAEIDHVEGGWANDPHDIGGETYRGIVKKWHAKKHFPEWARGERLPTDAEVEWFYRAGYWEGLTGPMIPFFSDRMVRAYIGVLINVEDPNFRTKWPPSETLKLLQLSLNVCGADLAVDGELGDQTLHALAAADEGRLYDAFRAAYLGRLTKSKTWGRHKRSWARRVRTVA